MRRPNHVWRQRPVPGDVVAELEHELELSHLTARLIAGRGVQDPDQARRFFARRLGDLHRPDGLPDIDRAATRLARAIDQRETILIHGDFDVDGTTAVTVLTGFCRACGHDAVAWIPDRRIDGYGLGEASLRAVREHQAQLMVTVDCGIIDHGWAERIETECDCDVVVTDHHLPGEILPTCTAVVNPNHPDSTYPDKGLAGVGVAWKLCWATGKVLCGSDRLSGRLRNYLMESLALVAIGTVADCAPLVDENRVLVHHGLRALERSTNPALRALCEHGRLEAPISSDDIGWRIGPLLNASGRLGSAMGTVHLLTAPDRDEAERRLRWVVEQNEERRRLTELLCDDLIAEIDSNPTYAQRCSLVFAGDGWHAGIVGIVANRLADRYGKPTAVIAIDEDEGKGSLRSIPGVHLGDAIDACRHLLLKGGGHASAAGVSIRRDQVDAFSHAFEDHVRSLAPGGPDVPGIEHDGHADIHDLDAGFFADLEALAPFGIGNPSPILHLRGVRFAGPPELFGRSGNHLRGALTDRHGGLRPFLAWKQGRHLGQFNIPRQRFDLLVRPEVNHWRGESQGRLVYIDGQRHDDGE